MSATPHCQFVVFAVRQRCRCRQVSRRCSATRQRINTRPVISPVHVRTSTRVQIQKALKPGQMNGMLEKHHAFAPSASPRCWRSPADVPRGSSVPASLAVYPGPAACVTSGNVARLIKSVPVAPCSQQGPLLLYSAILENKARLAGVHLGFNFSWPRASPLRLPASLDIISMFDVMITHLQT